MKTKRTGKILSLLLAVCMVFTMLPTMAFAETGDVDSGAPLGASEEITASAPLDEDVVEQTVEASTPEDEPNLPNELTAPLTEGGDDTATSSETPKETQTTVAVEEASARDGVSTLSTGTDITGKFTDANFLAEVRTVLGKGVSDPIYDTDNFSTVTVWDVSGKNIASLAGIEYFTALIYLNCSLNRLTVLDVSKNTALADLNCGKNRLTELNVIRNTKLTRLDCDDNQLTALNVSSNTALTYLSCGSNKSTVLDVSKNTALTTLYCSSSQLTALDVSKNIALTDLSCHSNRLTVLDVSKNTALTNLNCSNNQLTALNLTGLNISRFYGQNQAFSLTMAENGSSYTASVNMSAGTTFKNDALSYMGGTLTSTSKTAVSPAFTAPTGLDEKALTGTLTLIYPAGSVVNAETPSITGQPAGATYKQGDSAVPLSVTASVTDGGTLSYQWYSNTTNSTIGGTPAASSTTNGCTPSTTTVGTTYYYCVVMNTNNSATGNKTATATSNIAAVTVNAAILPSLPVASIPQAERLPDGKIKVSWNSVTNASSYQVKIYKDADAPITEDFIDGTELLINPPIDAGSYTFTVAAIGDGINYVSGPHSPKSDVLVVAPIGGTVTGAMDIGGETGKNLSVNLSGTGWTWTASSATLTITGDITGDIKFVGTGDVTIAVAGAHTVTGRIICNAGLLTINGGGTLNVNSGTATYPAITIRAYNGLTIDNVTVNATTTSLVGRCVYIDAGNFTMASGTLNANGVQTGLQVESGNISISGTANVAASTSGSFAIITNARITIGGNAVVTGDGGDIGTGILAENGIIINGGAVTARGIGIMSCGAISGNTGGITVNGGSLTVGDASASPVNGNVVGDLTVSGGVVTFTGTVSGTTSHTGGILNGNAPTGGTVTVTKHPQNVTVTQGRISGMLATEAVASNDKPVSYQWYRHTVGFGSDIREIMTGETNKTLTIPAKLTAGTYRYSCTYTAEGCEFVEGNIAIVTVKEPSGGGSHGGSGGGSYTPPSATTTTPQAPPNQPVASTTSVTSIAGTNGAASASVLEKTITDAIAKAQGDAKAQGNTANGISVALNITMPKGTTSLTATLTRSSLNSLVSAGVTSFELKGSPVTVSFDKKTLAEIQKQSSGNITITIAPNTSLSTSAKAIIGTRPVYDLTVSYTKNGENAAVTSFGGGKATVSIPYSPAKGEAVGALYAVYVDDKGNATRVAGSAYDANSRSILFTTTHFSLYGIGYTAPSAKFTDIGNHWAKDSIDHVVGRGLFSGAANKFNPDTAITRGDFIAALGRLAGVDTKAYTKSSFTDVKADSPFRPYIEWAYSKGIIRGIGNSQFAPDRTITREEMAVILQNYAKATSYKLPVTREATAYTDASGIDSAYKTAVTAMQQAGIMMGKQNNKFNPTGNPTRAEASAMIHRYIKLTIDPATAQGWALNDDGEYMYYKDSKAVSGTQTIGSAKYFFNTDGTLQTGWVKDSDNWYFYSGNIRLTGWRDISSGDAKNTYYFAKDGIMVSGKWLQLNGKWYYFYTDGSLAKDTKVDGYEVDKNGVRKSK